MNIVLYTSISEVNAITKQLNTLITLSGELREQSSIIDPVIHISNIAEYAAVVNYAYIQEFNRYYFVTNVDSVRNDLWRLTMHVDVLYTYEQQIKANSGIVARNEKEYDLKLNDGLFKTQQNPRISQHLFPSGFNHWNFVLAIAGN